MPQKNEMGFQSALFFIFAIGMSSILVGCGNDDVSSSLLPSSSDTCDGRAIQNRYIVRYIDGTWDYVEANDREEFRKNYVYPKQYEIAFIEYDQKILPKDFGIKNDDFESQDLTNPLPIVPLMTAAPLAWGQQAINARAAWSQNIRGQGVIVAVVDSGVDINHPKLSPNIYTNPGESGFDGQSRDKATNGVDDDGNGFIDDVNGYNFLNNNKNVSDEVEHGTHVAGIIGAYHADTEYSTLYPQGIAPAAKILPVKFIGTSGGSLSMAMRSVSYAVAQGAQVINASWGGTSCSKSLLQMMSDLHSQNILISVAAGNSRSDISKFPEYPAAFNLSNQITVGSHTASFARAFHSNYSTQLVHLFAPGESITNTIPGGGYDTLTGTSMATPFVSGAAALIKSSNPSLSMSQVRDAILGNVLIDPSYSNSTMGRLNVGAILENIAR
jgi:subtilisin family serine protease